MHIVGSLQWLQMNVMARQITPSSIVFSTVYLGEH